MTASNSQHFPFFLSPKQEREFKRLDTLGGNLIQSAMVFCFIFVFTVLSQCGWKETTEESSEKSVEKSNKKIMK